MMRCDHLFPTSQIQQYTSDIKQYTSDIKQYTSGIQSVQFQFDWRLSAQYVAWLKANLMRSDQYIYWLSVVLFHKWFSSEVFWAPINTGGLWANPVCMQ